VDEDARALEVAQELVPEPGAGVRPLDEPRHVGDDEALPAPADDAEVRHERGERVVGDLRAGREIRLMRVDFPAFG